MILNKEKGLSYCAGLEDLYVEILETYIEKGHQYVQELDTYFSEENWKEYARVSHTLKSTSLTIGAEDFSEIAKQHEFAAKEGNIEFIKSSYSDFKAELKDIIAVVEKEV